MADMSDQELLDALGVEVKAEKKAARTPREERIIAGFEEIKRFVDQHGRLPQHGEDRDIFERLYAVRLDKMRGSAECKDALAGLDPRNLLEGEPLFPDRLSEDMDDDALLAELGVHEDSESDITKLTHVKTRAERRAAEEIAQRDQCRDFGRFKPLFVTVQEELKSGVRTSRRFREDASIQQGEFFILGGQIAYVAEIGEEIRAPNGEADARMRVVFDNGTESNLLRRSLQRALYKDEAGRRITDPSAGPLFSGEQEEGDTESGTIYVLRSLSDHPVVREHRDILHKIGVTGGSVEKRIANAMIDSTFLLAEVEIVATYDLFNINRTRLEKIIHRVLEPARLDIEIKDRFGHPVTPREWFLVPIFVIDELVRKIQDGTISEYVHDVKSASLVLRRNTAGD